METEELKANEKTQDEIPNGYRQGIVTAITIFLAFTLAFLRYWGFEAPGDWWWGSIIIAVLLGLSLLMQIYALCRALNLRDNKPAEYTKTVRWFIIAIALLIFSLVISMFVFGIGPKILG